MADREHLVPPGAATPNLWRQGHARLITGGDRKAIGN